MEHHVGRKMVTDWLGLTQTISYDSEFDQDPKPSAAAAFIDFSAFDLIAPRTLPKVIVDWEPLEDFFNTINPPESDAK